MQVIFDKENTHMLSKIGLSKNFKPNIYACFFLLPHICSIYEKVQHGDKVNLEILKNLQRFSILECEYVVSVMLFLYVFVMYIWISTLLVAE
jgi:hypothetical protein